MHRMSPTAARQGRVGAIGGVMLELLLAVALFVAAAIFTLAALRNALDGTRRAELRARATDLAESRLVELDAGLVSAGELGDPLSNASSSELSVTVELIASSTASSLALARATVREVVGGVPGPVIATAERLVAADARRGEDPSP
jgi:hypothetical protein